MHNAMSAFGYSVFQTGVGRGAFSLILFKHLKTTSFELLIEYQS
jgi:hypothetical protein